MKRNALLGPIERAWRHSPSRRRALLSLGALLAGKARAKAQLDPRPLEGHPRVAGLDEMMSAFDFEPVCYANMPLQLYDYMAHGGDSEWTRDRNRRVFDWVTVRSRAVAATHDAPDTRTSILGLDMDFPIMVAPSSRHGDLHPDAEAGTYRGAAAAGVPMIVANAPSMPHEEIAAAADGPRWIQFYPTPNVVVSRRRLERFQAAGAQAIVVTVDQQATMFERDLHDRHLGGRPARARAESLQSTATSGPELYGLPVPGRLWYTWEYLDEIRDVVRVPMLIKGILTAEDARLCVERGFDGVIVSNHGARGLDYSPSSLEVLPEIVAEVDGKIPVLIDSGFRSGADIFKALALGAKAVCLGRAARWGLGAFGSPGVTRLLEILQGELRDTMAVSGWTRVSDLEPSAVWADFP